MGQSFGLVIVIGFLALIGLMMRMMWRQMRRVNAHTAATRREAAPVTVAPVEAYDEETGQYRPVAGEANEELMRMGAQADRPVGLWGP